MITKSNEGFPNIDRMGLYRMKEESIPGDALYSYAELERELLLARQALGRAERDNRRLNEKVDTLLSERITSTSARMQDNLRARELQHLCQQFVGAYQTPEDAEKI